MTASAQIPKALLRRVRRFGRKVLDRVRLLVWLADEAAGRAKRARGLLRSGIAAAGYEQAESELRAEAEGLFVHGSVLVEVEDDGERLWRSAGRVFRMLRDDDKLREEAEAVEVLLDGLAPRSPGGPTPS